MDLLIGIYGLKSCSVMRLLISMRDLSMMKTEIAKLIFLIHDLNEFIKLNVKHFSMLKSKDAF